MYHCTLVLFFYYRHSVFCTLVPVLGTVVPFVDPRPGFGVQGTSAKTTLLETTLLRTPKKWFKHILGPVHGRTAFSRIFVFEPPVFFRGFSRRIFSPHFRGKKCPEKSSKKIPGKILQNSCNKNPRHVSAEGPGQHIAI